MICVTHYMLQKTLQLSLQRALCKRQDSGYPPMCGQGQGFATKRTFCGGEAIISHTRQVENKLKSSQAFGYGVCLTSLPLQCLYAMYDSSSRILIYSINEEFPSPLLLLSLCVFG